jgi:hypothetical protein
MSDPIESDKAAQRARAEDRYEGLIERAVAKEPMPFGAWASSQSSGHLLASTAEYLAVQLDHAYGGPAIVDRFFERGLKDIIYSDIGSTRIKQWFEVEQIVEVRSEARRKIAEKRNEIEALEQDAKWKRDNRSVERAIADCRKSIEDWTLEVCNQLDRQYFLALELGLTRLAKQYEEMMWNFPGK